MNSARQMDKLVATDAAEKENGIKSDLKAKKEV